MKNELIVKVYDIDYSFIIKHYLDPQLWDKKWTLLVYKEYKFTINLSSIDVRNRKIYFVINGEYYDNDYKHEKCDTISYDLRNSNITILKKQINGSIERVISYIENDKIRETEEYKDAEILENQHEDNLRDIAIDFLDDNGIDIDEVRDAYIDWYIGDNCDKYDYTGDIMRYYDKRLLYDLYIVFYNITKQKDKLEYIQERLSDSDSEYSNNIMYEINQEIVYLDSDDYVEEMRDNLRSIN